MTGLAMLVSRWSANVVVLTDGPGYLTPSAWQRRYRQKIGIREEPVACFLSSGRQDLRRIKFMGASQHQRSPPAADIGACPTSKATVWVDSTLQTSISGSYAADDIKPGT